MRTEAPQEPRVLYRGRKFSFELRTERTPDGRRFERALVRHPGAAVILPLLDEPGRPRRIVMIRVHRAAVGADLWELPAGTLDRPEEPRACAERELVEETGYKAATIRPLGRFYTTPGLTDELMHAFVAEGLTHVGQRLEEDERLTVHPVTIQGALDLAESGELIDGKSILTILLAQRRGWLGPEA